jgi:probable phosphoglycerate mutase
MELVIIRHGRPERHETPGVPADPPLSAIGRQQAEATALHLANEKIDAVVASPMVRARQTAAPFATHLGVEAVIVPNLLEVDAHRDHYIPNDEFTADHPFIQEMRADPMSMFAYHGGFEAWRSKVVGAFDEIVAMHKGQTVAVFCHGMVMSTFLTHVIGYNDPFKFQHDFCGITRVTASSSGLRTPRSVNETAHVRHLI